MNMNTSGLGTGAPERTPRIEVGVIDDVDRSVGTCHVVTEKGRHLTARIGSPMAGATGEGLRLTPMREARCLVCFFEVGGVVRPNDAYLLSTFQPLPETEEDAPDWGAPGDVRIGSASGGGLLVSQGGMINLEADPWARQALLPTSKTIKQWAKNHERLYTPVAHERTIHDDEAEVAFRELALNSRFLHREGDTGPDVLWTLGNAQGSADASPLHPQSGALSDFRIERRSETAEARERYVRQVGAPERLILRETATDIQSGAEALYELGVAERTFLRRRVTQGDVTWGLEIGSAVTEDGEAWRQTVTTDQAALTFRRGHIGSILTETVLEADGEEVFRRRVTDDGTLHINNPTWALDIEGTGAMVCTNGTTTLRIDGDKVTVDNGQTSLTLTGSNIYLGDTAGSEAEPVALGKTLVAFLDAFQQWTNTHTHTHPMGPTGTPIVPFAQSTTPILSRSNYVD